jgi:hypothetical protein
MEHTEINSVNESLLNYNITQSHLATTRDLLAKAHAELDILRSQEKSKVVVFEKRVSDPNYYGNYKTISTLELDVNDPVVSSTLLETMTKVKTDELTDQITKLENTIKQLTVVIDQSRDLIESERKNNGKRVREVEEGKQEAIRKLKKGYEETILELEIDKETLAKSLSDLKKDKTQIQIEVARQEEIQQLEDKASALQNFKAKVEELENNPIKLRKFLKSVQAVANAKVDYPWIDKMWSRIYSATNTVDNFIHMLKSVGKLPEKPVPTPVNNWQYGNKAFICNCCGDECDCDGDRW